MKKDYNMGIALLRVWMCFEVVLCHFRIWPNNEGIFYRYQVIAVPVFMLSSFVFVDINKLIQKNGMRKRMYRLLVPHLVWTCVYYVVCKMIDIKNGSQLIQGKTDFVWQLLFGHSYNATLWFQVNLIVLTILFWIIFKVLKQGMALIVTMVLGYFALYLQYAEVLRSVLSKIVWPESIMGGYFSENYVIWTVGRLVEMVPYAVIGIIAGKIKIIDTKKTYRIYILIGSYLLLNLFNKCNFFKPIDGFGYQGMQGIFVGSLLLILFSNLPFEKIPLIAKKVIFEISKYTMGIYFMHRLVGMVFYKTPLNGWLKMRQGTIYDCCIIFIASYVIARVIYKIPIKWIKMSVS